MEHERHNYDLEDRVSSGEAELRKRICRHRCEDKVTESTAYSDNTVLNMYLEKGTQESPIKENRSTKLSNVGLIT